MKIAIIGGASVANKLSALAVAAGHEVTIGARDPAKVTELAAPATTIQAAIDPAEIVILAIPYLALSEALPPLAEALNGKLVIDATNPLNPDYSPVETATSAAEEVQSMLPGARVVKAFNMIFADAMTPSGLDRNGKQATVFVASDDEEARQTVAKLAQELGFLPVEVGVLSGARYLEGMAHLNIHVAFAMGGGTDVAFIYDQR